MHKNSTAFKQREKHPKLNIKHMLFGTISLVLCFTRGSNSTKKLQSAPPITGVPTQITFT